MLRKVDPFLVSRTRAGRESESPRGQNVFQHQSWSLNLKIFIVNNMYTIVE